MVLNSAVSRHGVQLALTSSLATIVCSGFFCAAWPGSAAALGHGGEPRVTDPLDPTNLPSMIADAAAFRTPFDPEATARLRTGEMVEAIQASGRQAPSATTPNLIPVALLIQAGLRTLLPPAEREGISLPGEPGKNDPESLIKAQQNLAVVYRSGQPATSQQRRIAVEAISEGANSLEKYGYTKAASALKRWLAENSK